MTRQPDAADDTGDDPQTADGTTDPRRDHRDHARGGSDRAHGDRARRFELDATVVRYDARPDRRTIHPADATGVERMATWLTADASAFVPLDDER
jgi:hypothetical protein